MNKRYPANRTEGRRNVSTDESRATTLVLGLGNLLLRDDGFGVHVIQALERERSPDDTIAIRDGGTIGLALLSEIEDSDSLIVVDAMEMGAEPGTLRVLEGADMDNQLKGKKRTAHEVALADLMAAAMLSGKEPRRRVLVAAQPGSTDLGMEPGPEVGAAIPLAVERIRTMLAGWSDA